MKVLFRSMALAAVVGLVACNKDEDDDTQKNNSDNIVGSWTGVKLEAYAYNTNTNDTAMSLVFPGGFSATFNSDNSYEALMLGDTTTGSYSISGNMITMIDSDQDTTVGEITTLTSSSLVIEEEEVDGEDVYEAKMELKK